MSDLISRQAAIDAIWKPIIKPNEMIFDALKQAQQNEIETLPPVDLERKPGKWIRGEAYPHRIYCSECYKTFIPNDELRAWANGDLPRKYCPECGAKMEVEDE